MVRAHGGAAPPGLRGSPCAELEGRTSLQFCVFVVVRLGFSFASPTFILSGCTRSPAGRAGRGQGSPTQWPGSSEA